VCGLSDLFRDFLKRGSTRRSRQSVIADPTRRASGIALPRAGTLGWATFGSASSISVKRKSAFVSPDRQCVIVYNGEIYNLESFAQNFAPRVGSSNSFRY